MLSSKNTTPLSKLAIQTRQNASVLLQKLRPCALYKNYYSLAATLVNNEEMIK